MTKTTRATAAANPDRSLANPIYSHEALLNRFDQVRDSLTASGWVKARVDTYEHPDLPGHSIKHQFVHGEIEIHHTCPDRTRKNWVTVVLSRYRDLPTMEAIRLGLIAGCPHAVLAVTRIPKIAAGAADD